LEKGMNKTDLVAQLARDTRMTKADCKRVVDALFATRGVLSRSLRKGEPITLIGFGTFELKALEWRDGTNPATGETIRLAPVRKVRFRTGTALTKALTGSAAETSDPHPPHTEGQWDTAAQRGRRQ
jgi:nucleoid DNA-binding protein